MKLLKLIFTLSLVAIISCKKEKQTNKETEKVHIHKKENKYPELMQNVFKNHGGIDNWKNQKILTFEQGEGDEKEITTTALHSRKAIIETKNNNIGFDGKNVWVLEKDTTAYKGNAKFYYNLMFYFYAMPFVLADDGIVYEKVPDLEYEGKSYPGMMISYNTGVGLSPKDQYIIYVDKETNEMAWLGFTVTYFSNKKGTRFNFINYKEWQVVNGIKLPKKLVWYKSEDNKPTEIRNSAEFKNIKLSTTINEDLFNKPEKAKIVE